MPFSAKNVYQAMDPSSPEIPSDLFEVLSPLLTESRRQKMRSVAAGRIPWLRCVLQDIHGSHNISACLRSCEAFGVGDVDILSLLPKTMAQAGLKKSFQASSVACGVSHWLNIREHQGLEVYRQKLTDQGFRLYAGLPSSSSRVMDLKEILLASKIEDFRVAVLFGNEHGGIHDDWHPHLDGYFSIPTSGFAESLNVSVAVAVTLHHLLFLGSSILPKERYYLSAQAVEQQLGVWLTRTLKDWQKKFHHLKNSSHLSAKS